MQEGKRRLAREKGFSSEVKHHRRVLADGVKKDWVGHFGNDFAHDLDRLGFEPTEVRSEIATAGGFCTLPCIPTDKICKRRFRSLQYQRVPADHVTSTCFVLRVTVKMVGATRSMELRPTNAKSRNLMGKKTRQK